MDYFHVQTFNSFKFIQMFQCSCSRLYIMTLNGLKFFLHHFDHGSVKVQKVHHNNYSCFR